MKKRVAVVSPFRADTITGRADNFVYAHDAARDCLARGEAPFASHLFYPGRLLNDDDFTERTRGIECGWAWLSVADLVAVYQDRGISDGMLGDIAQAEAAGVPVEYRKLAIHESG